jgi:hypothetical protein
MAFKLAGQGTCKDAAASSIENRTLKGTSGIAQPGLTYLESEEDHEQLEQYGRHSCR